MGRPKKIKPEWKLSNVLPDLPDERDYIFTTAMSAATLPEIIDHRKYAREIENQGSTGSCVANATVSALELLHKKSNKDINLSRLFLYYNLREPYENLKNKDIGSYTRDGFKRVKELGICTEETWKFDETKVNFSLGFTLVKTLAVSQLKGEIDINSKNGVTTTILWNEDE